MKLGEENRIIVFGGSAGAFQPLSEIIGFLNFDQDLSVFVVLHSASNTLANVLQKLLPENSKWKISYAENGTSIEPGHVYIAPPDHHMLLKEHSIVVNKEPRVNHNRPSIDLLFRSAAVAHGPHVIGTILSGSLYDGAAGVDAVKKCGGVVIVQDPEKALFPDLPKNAIDATEIDHIKSASEIGSLINQIAGSPVNTPHEIPEEIALENKLDMKNGYHIELVDQLGTRANISCPECGGPLWEVDPQGTPRYRCHIGHSLTMRSLLDSQNLEIEKTLLVALRTMEERMRIQEKMINSDAPNVRLQERFNETKTHVERLRKLILQIL